MNGLRRRLTTVRFVPSAAVLVLAVACGPRAAVPPVVGPAPPPEADAGAPVSSASAVAVPAPRIGCQATPEATQGAACGDQAMCPFTDPKVGSIRCFCRETNPSNGPASVSPKAYACVVQTRADGCPTEPESATPCAPDGRRCEYGSGDGSSEITCQKKTWTVTRQPKLIPRP